MKINHCFNAMKAARKIVALMLSMVFVLLVGCDAEESMVPWPQETAITTTTKTTTITTQS